MTNKKLKTPLFLAASLLLVGCSSDTIVARPTGWGDEKIIVNAGDKDNKMKNIYDAIKALGDTNSNVLNKVIYDISKTTIGKFIKDSDADTDLTLSDIYANYQEKGIEYATDDNFKKFVDSHSKYKAEDTSAYLEDDEPTKKVLVEDEKYKVSLNKILNQYNEIVENIYEKLFDDIKGGSYSTQTHKLFDEKLYYQHLKKELYINEEKIEKPEKYVSNKAFLTKTKGTSWKEYVNAVYDSTEEKFKSGYLQVAKDGKSTGIYDEYINRKILPELYKTYLTETYVKEQRYSSLGRSYARKVNMITVPNGGQSYSGNILKMFNYFAKTYITGDTVGSLDISYDFENITKAMIGFVGAPDISSTSGESLASIEYKLLNYTISNTKDGTTWNKRTNFTPIKIGSENLRWPCYTDENGKPTSIDSTTGMPTGTTTYVYYGTKLGDLVEKYMKIYDITSKTETDLTKPNFTFTPKSNPDETAYNDITNNGAYSVATGLAVKEKDLRLNDMTKDGWFLKNGGLTDLDSTFRDRLFNISTSNTIDDKSKKESLEYKSGEYVRYFGDKSVSDLSKRKAFLVDSTKGEDKPWESVVLIGDSNYYIIEVEEAANTSKLSNANNVGSYYMKKTEKGDTPSKGAIATANTVDKLTRDIVKANSTSDTYKKNANEYYLMISNIVFYDQSVYDYFKSQFPDLFK